MKRWLAMCMALMILLPMLGATVRAEELNYEVISFTVGTEQEKAHLIAGALWHDKDRIRYADKHHQIVYKYDLGDVGTIRSLELSGVIYQQLHLSVSTDGENYTTVYLYDGDSSRGLSEAKRTFLLTKFIDLAQCSTLYVRITDASVESGYGGAVRAKEPLELKVGYFNDPTIGRELHSFDVGSEEEKSYLVKEGRISGSGIRYADAENSFVYRFPIRNTVNVQKIELSGMIYQQLHLSVSTDGENYTTVYLYESTDADDHGLSLAKRTFDLTEFVDLATSKTIYLRFSDAYTANGWGGAISPKEPLSLKVTYIKPTIEELNAFEMTRTEHRVPVFGCNSEWGGGYVLDTTDPSAGYAALSLALRGGDTLGQIVLDEPVDARGMDTLEFDLYVSDVSVFDLPFSGYLMLSSAGSKDAAALRWSLRAVFAAIEQKQSGWNHVVLPISSASAVNGGAGVFDLGAINYIALGWTDMPVVAGTPRWKLDSFCLTDRQKARCEEILMEKSYLIEQMRTIRELIEQELNESSFKTVARLVSNSRYEIAHLTQEELNVISSLGLFVSVDEAERLVAAYEQRIVSDVPVGDEIIVPEPDAPMPEPEPEQPNDPMTEPQPSEQDSGLNSVFWIAGVTVIVLGAAVVAAWLAKKKKA